MGVIKIKMGKIGSKKFEQKRKAKWVKKKENLVKAWAGGDMYKAMHHSYHAIHIHR